MYNEGFCIYVVIKWLRYILGAAFCWLPIWVSLIVIDTIREEGEEDGEEEEEKEGWGSRTGTRLT